MIGLFIGKFQPFHNGHLEAIKHILGECQQIKIAIGSSQEARPFTFDQRKEMITLSLQEAGITKYEVHPLPDTNNHDSWLQSILKLQPFDIVYTRNPQLIQTLKQKSIQTKQHPQFGEVSSGQIRELLQDNQPINKFVPQAVATYLKSLQ